MERASKWSLTDKEKERFITTLTPHLAILRTKAEISQEEIANLIGVSRQTYSSIERKIRKMSWSTYLSLVLFYDHNQKTHQLMRQLSLFSTPEKLSPVSLKIRTWNTSFQKKEVTCGLIPGSSRKMQRIKKMPKPSSISCAVRTLLRRTSTKSPIPSRMKKDENSSIRNTVIIQLSFLMIKHWKTVKHSNSWEMKMMPYTMNYGER